MSQNLSNRFLTTRETRLGKNGFQEIKKHKFFLDLDADWDHLQQGFFFPFQLQSVKKR